MFAQVTQSNADKEFAIVASESPSLAFIGLCGHDLALRICHLRFDILFHGDRLQVGYLFRHVHRPGNYHRFRFLQGLRSTSGSRLLHSLGGGRVFSDLHAQASDVQVPSEGALPVRRETRDGVGHGAMGSLVCSAP